MQSSQTLRFVPCARLVSSTQSLPFNSSERVGREIRRFRGTFCDFAEMVGYSCIVRCHFFSALGSRLFRHSTAYHRATLERTLTPLPEGEGRLEPSASKPASYIVGPYLPEAGMAPAGPLFAG